MLNQPILPKEPPARNCAFGRTLRRFLVCAFAIRTEHESVSSAAPAFEIVALGFHHNSGFAGNVVPKPRLESNRCSSTLNLRGLPIKFVCRYNQGPWSFNMDRPTVSLPQTPPRQRPQGTTIVLTALGCLMALGISSLLVLRLFGLLIPFNIPTGGMAPAASAGDHVFVEGISFLFRAPRRGDVVAFKTAGLASLPQDQTYLKRIAGEPGEHVQLVDAVLYINDHATDLTNVAGPTRYISPSFNGVSPPPTDTRIPLAHYFVLGDNTMNSLDSRYYGAIPRTNIIGRAAWCYWPPNRIGRIR